jgi:Fe-S-cluster-containing hydrogenase component 2
LIFEMPLCGGCRTCEMACSFHHKGEFSPSVSSIKIIDKTQCAGFDVLLSEKDDGDTMACDGCRELRVPLCLEYCTKKDDLKKILGDFFQKLPTT